MSKNNDMESDVYSRVDYRRVVAWPERIRREEPLLRRVLETAPENSVLDLGCGTGEHSRFMADIGFRVLGLDRSAAMLEQARQESRQGVEFVEADICDLDEVAQGHFGAAISLGNTLPHITDEERLHRLFATLGKLLPEGGAFLFQVLNYERVFEQGVRWLPLNFRQEEGGEIIFLRLMEPLPGGRVRFCPSTLRYAPDSEPPLELVRSKMVELRGWTRKDLFPMLEEAGFKVEAVFGDMTEGAFVSAESMDLVIVARR